MKNYSFEHITGISEQYICTMQEDLARDENKLLSKRAEYEDFILAQKYAGDFDYEKGSTLLSEIHIIEENIKEKQKIVHQF